MPRARLPRPRGNNAGRAESVVRRFLALLAALLCSGAYAQSLSWDDVLILRHEFWTEIAPKPEFEVDPEPFDPAKPTEDILAEAAWVYSGMIRGFSVSYVPYDKSRGVAEAIKVEPLGPEAVKREELRRGESRIVKNTFRAYAEYVPDQAERALYEAWRGAAFPAAGGEGRARLTDGPAARITAMEDGLKNAVREYARIQVKNKPKLVRAEAALERPPSIVARAGEYVARLRIRIKVVEILPYAAY